jgi:plasmid stability protein
MSLVPESGPEVPLATPSGRPLQLDPRELPGHIALAGTGTVPAGRYAGLRLGLGGATRTLPLALTLDSGRELDLVVGVNTRPTGATARIASLRQR